MQKDTKQEYKTNQSKVILENRRNISLTGVEEVYSSNENSLTLKISGCKSIITGSGITISKLDIENKILEAIGNINSIKFLDNQENFFKRIFK